MSKIDREKVYAKYNGKCGYCGDSITIKSMQVDHIQAHFHTWTEQEAERHNITKGTHDIENLMPSCRRCNLAKSTFSIEKFREQLSLQLERVNKYSANYRLAKAYGQVTETPHTIIFYFEKLR